MWELIVSHKGIKDTSFKCSNSQVQTKPSTMLVSGCVYGFLLDP